MKARILAILGAVMVLGLLVVAPVAAQGPDAEQAAAGVVGDGDGLVMLFGSGMVDLSGNGILWVKPGPGTVVEVSGYGEKKVFPDGWHQYAGFNGNAHIEGRSVRVIVAGVGLHLEARGQGRAFFWGHGTHLHGDRTGAWGTGGLGASVGYTGGGGR